VTNTLPKDSSISPEMRTLSMKSIGLQEHNEQIHRDIGSYRGSYRYLFDEAAVCWPARTFVLFAVLLMFLSNLNANTSSQYLPPILLS